MYLCVWIFMYLSMHMFVPVSLCTLMWECMSVCAYLCLCLSTCLFVCVSVSMHIIVCECEHVCAHIPTPIQKSSHGLCGWAMRCPALIGDSSASSGRPSLLPLRDKALSRGQVTCSKIPQQVRASLQGSDCQAHIPPMRPSCRSVACWHLAQALLPSSESSHCGQ